MRSGGMGAMGAGGGLAQTALQGRAAGVSSVTADLGALFYSRR